MKAYYETNRDKAGDIHVSRSRDHTYPSHFHMSVELFAVRHGSYLLTANGVTHEVTDGCAAFIDCYDVHAYERLEEEADDCVIVIPYSLALRFNEVRENRQITHHVIKDAALCARLITLADSFLLGEERFRFLTCARVGIRVIWCASCEKQVFIVDEVIADSLGKCPPERRFTAAVQPNYGDSLWHSHTSFHFLDLIIHYLRVIVKKIMKKLHIASAENMQKLRIFVAYF